MVMPLRIVFFSDGYIGKTTVLLNCNQTNQQPIFDVVNTSEAGEFVSEDRMIFKLTHKCACPNACLITPSGHSTKKPTTTVVPTKDPTGDPDNVVVPVVASVAGVLGLVIFPIVIWQLLCKQNDNERQHLLNQNNPGAGAVDESENRFSSPTETTEGSELTSGRGSASLTKLSSPDSTCSDITVPNKYKTDNLNSKV
ncbi:hypothetical protein ACROYT_G021889 [Oculina patagonica]